jgi:predicted nucleic acid-binding protein
MRLLIDTNVLLDVVFDREGAAASAAVIERCRGEHEGWIAWHTLSTLAYVLGRQIGPEEVREAIGDLLTWAQIAPTRTEHARSAVAQPLRDFEDAMQIAAAEACDADCIVTRNVRDFRGGSIDVITPEGLVRPRSLQTRQTATSSARRRHTRR